ncbi:DUF1642 domain-containing protein [Lactiplantibacillus plantarum]|uniref:DUF1642 domain-containing protein n=1 Tax=Lactiplantibacillus plantarum TaxID=1590 RepID=UPI0015DD659B|nr:DUF1642 domain-containing protein [Lactiplantibacillus plantarum]QLL37809.1 hypothetical protein FEM49_00726 [Lactiplantibacillus plantarum]
MKFYRKQPLEAEQFDGSQKLVFGYSVIPSGIIDAITGKPVYYSMLVDDVCQDSDDDTGVVLEVSDWIVKEADEIEVIADDVFKQTYAELPVIPEEVAYMIKQAKNGDYKLGVALYGAYEGVWKPSVAKWILMHTEVFARAWINGYTVEADK